MGKALMFLVLRRVHWTGVDLGQDSFLAGWLIGPYQRTASAVFQG